MAATDRLGRGELFTRVLAALGTRRLTTREVAAAVPTTVANAGVALCRCADRGLAKRVSRKGGTGRVMVWKATGAVYVPLPNGAPQQPERPKSRHRPKLRPAVQQPSVRTPAQVAMRERLYVQSTQPAAPAAIPAPSTEAFMAAHPERVQRLPSSVYVPSPVRPCGWKS